MRSNFNLSAADFIALSAVHSASPTVNRWVMGTMYHKMIAERPTFYWDKGGDTTFGMGDEQKQRAFGQNQKNVTNNYYTAVGDIHGNPVATRAWRITCQN